MVDIRLSAYAVEGNLLSESIHAMKKNKLYKPLVRDWSRSKC